MQFPPLVITGDALSEQNISYPSGTKYSSWNASRISADLGLRLCPQQMWKQSTYIMSKTGKAMYFTTWESIQFSQTVIFYFNRHGKHAKVSEKPHTKSGG